jgi:flagellar biosynthesis/type III secretory pathway protein FliH
MTATGRVIKAVDFAAQQIALQERQSRLTEAQLVHTTELAKLLAERLIAESIALDPALVGRMARQSLQQFRESSALAVRAHPDDHPQIQQQFAALNLRSVSLLADTELRRGELCIDSHLGQLELRIGPALDRLVDRVRSLLHDPP